tara:strand:- start:397 stop:615 length:219 start_codon:yes stop_codon:yes gene_type:complete
MVKSIEIQVEERLAKNKENARLRIEEFEIAKVKMGEKRKKSNAEYREKNLIDDSAFTDRIHKLVKNHNKGRK